MLDQNQVCKMDYTVDSVGRVAGVSHVGGGEAPSVGELVKVNE